MNIGRILGVVLSIMVAIGAINNGMNNEDGISFDLIGNNGTKENNNVNFNDVSLTEDNSSNTEVIKYTNKQPYAIDITAGDITINCTGNNKNDVELVKNNMKIKALFSNELNGKKTSNITIRSKETAYIYIVNEYSGEYPTSEVKCEYSINIADF